MKLRRFIQFLMLIGIVLTSSCEEVVDGDGPTMKWTLIETGERWNQGRDFSIPHQGGEITLRCNISWWVSGPIFYDGELYELNYTQKQVDIPGFVNIRIEDKNTLVLVFLENQNETERKLYIDTQHGDSYSSFEFTQEGR